MQQIIPPTTCPSCDSVLDVVNHVLYCREISCAAQATKKIENFAKTLKVKGLGPKAIQKLGVATSQELYSLTKDELGLLLQSERIGDKIFVELQQSKNAPLNLVLPALSIPLIGNTASSKLAKVCLTLDDITDETCREAGLGPKATENLMNYLESNMVSLRAFPFSFKFDKPREVKQSSGVVCISGKLKSFETKAKASESLEQNGFTVKSTLTKDVTILINESGIESAKTAKARKAGVSIVTDLKEFLGELNNGTT